MRKRKLRTQKSGSGRKTQARRFLDCVHRKPVAGKDIRLAPVAGVQAEEHVLGGGPALGLHSREASPGLCPGSAVAGRADDGRARGGEPDNWGKGGRIIRTTREVY